MKKFIYLLLLIFFLDLQCLWAEQAILKLDLNKSIAIALEKNLSLKNAQARVREAQGKLEEARAGKNPSLSLDASFTRMEPIAEFTIPEFPMKVKIGKEDNYNYKATLKQLISSFGKIESAEKVAHFNLEATKEEYKKIKNEVVLAVEEAYYNVLKSSGLKKICQENLAVAEEHLKIAQTLFKAGVVARYDVLRAEVAVATARKNLLSAENAFNLSCSSLLNILNLDLETQIEVIDVPEYKPKEVNLEAGKIEALQARPEMRKMSLLLQMGEAAVSLARSQSNPNLAFLSSYEYKTATALGKPQLWQATLALNIPLFDGGLTKAKVEQAEEALNQLRLASLELKNGIILEVKHAFLNLKEAEERLRVTRENVKLAKEALKVAKIRYKAGMSTYVELNDAQVCLLSAEISYLNAVYDCQVCFARWLKSLGKGEKK